MHLVTLRGGVFNGLGQAPAPTLAVVFGRLEVLGQVVENGGAIRVDGSAAASVSAAPAGFVVGQDNELAENLQTPCVAVAASAQDHAGEAFEERGNLLAVFILLGQRHGLEHELQCAGTVAVKAVDELSAWTTAVSTVEFAGYDCTVVRDVHAVTGGCPKDLPVAGVSFDD